MITTVVAVQMTCWICRIRPEADVSLGNVLALLLSKYETLDPKISPFDHALFTLNITEVYCCEQVSRCPDFLKIPMRHGII